MSGTWPIGALHGGHPMDTKNMSVLNSSSPVTALICTYNGEKYIRTTIDSLLNQTLLPRRIVVVDDASSDGTVEILQEYVREGQITLQINASNRGMCESANQAIDAMDTKYLLLIGHDDVALPERIERQVGFMNADDRLGCTGSFIYHVDESGRRIGKGVLDILSEHQLLESLRSGEPFALYAPAVMIRRQALENPRLRFRPEMWLAEDLDLWNRIAESGWLVLAQPEFLTEYRVHGKSAIGSGFVKSRRQYEYMRACLRARRGGEPEPSLEEFYRRYENMGLGERVNWYRKTFAKGLYRSAATACGGRAYVRSVGSLLMSLFLQPTYATKRLVRQAFGPVGVGRPGSLSR
jgi:glycosyltransferase involved in cell wall biosynthesis